MGPGVLFGLPSPDMHMIQHVFLFCTFCKENIVYNIIASYSYTIMPAYGIL